MNLYKFVNDRTRGRPHTCPQTTRSRVSYPGCAGPQTAVILKILLIEDDIESARYVELGLTDAGHTVALAVNGDEGLARAGAEAWDLLIVDRMLPRLDGLGIVEKLRQAGDETPILFLTTLGGVDDRVHGLNAGADDYLVKPFAFSELQARVAALTRRAHRQAVETTLQVADLKLDLLSRTVSRGGEPIELLPREFRLLEYLMRNAGHTVTRAMLLQNVWEVHFDPNTSVVETHISRLRGKIEHIGAVAVIHTVRGVGYSLRASE